jgi:hypothetical protein
VAGDDNDRNLDLAFNEFALQVQTAQTGQTHV